MRTIHRWLTRIAAFLFDALAVVTGFYYSKKYTATLKRLGLRPESDNADQPGIIIVQIDGLSYDHLLQALADGRLPYVRRMIKRGDVALSRWRCGLPSTTPAAQAGIMFGNNEGIPAFRWYDKQRSASLVCKLPGTVASLQSQLAQNPGILTQGVSYVNIFDGGAANSLFTLSTLQPRHLFAGVQGLGFIALFLLNPIRALRILYLVLKEYFTDALQRLSSRLKGQPYLPFIGIFPLLRIFSNVIFREIVTFAVLVDIYRGVPAIYATYYGYDELAHHFGIHSIATHQALRDVDGCIKQIDRLRRVGLSRPYALFVLSDHGLTPSVPFEERYGQSLGQYIAQQTGQEVVLVEHAGGEEQYLAQTRYLLDELKTIEDNLSPAAARVARRIRLLVRRRLSLPNSELPAWNVQRRHDVVVKSSGSLAHVYFNIASQPLDLSEVSAAFPDLVIKLLEHEGIWLVVAREREQVLIMSQQGILTYDASGMPYIEGENPLLRLPEPWHAAEQIRRIACFPQSGDLILFGNYDPEKDLVICFERQRASHGGVGGAQDYPFILYPRYLNWDLSAVQNARDLYPLFARQRNLMPGKGIESDYLELSTAASGQKQRDEHVCTV